MSAEDVARNENADVNRAVVPVSGISMPAHLGVGSDLVDGIDYIVWIQVMFDVSSGKKVTPILVWKRLQARGIRSTKNRDELVGKNTVYESFSRIIDAGYFRRYEKPNEKHPGRKGPIAYEVYDNPAWNPDWQLRQVGSDPLCAPAAPESAPEKGQVRMLPGAGEAVEADSAPTGKSAGQNASRDQGSVVLGSGVPGSGKRRVPAGRNASPIPGNVEPSPPHPPEGEVGTTSPSPHKPAAAPRREKRAAAPDVDPQAAAAAAKFLMKLPGEWAAGLQRAESLAPWLVQNAELTGWELDLSLRMYLTRPEPGKKQPENHGAVLGFRIKNMQERESVLQAAAEVEAQKDQPAPQAKPGVPAWCTRCNNGEDPGEVLFMRTIPSPDPLDDTIRNCPDCHPAEIARRNRAGA